MTFKRMIVPTLFIFLFNSSLAAVCLAVPLQKPTPQGIRFPMKYEMGTELIDKGKKMKVTVGKQSIICETKKRVPFSIPVAAVTEVSYDIKARRRLGAAVVAGVLFWPVAPVFIFTKSRKHFVNILWEEDGTKKEVIFKVGKGEYASFLNELQEVTNKPWKNMVAERKRTRQEIKQKQKALKRKKDRKLSVQIDRMVRLGEVDLNPGLYQMVLLQRGENQGELYFFAGKKVETKKIVAVAPVEIMAQASDVTAAQVLYEEEGEVAAISKIRMPTKTLRVIHPASEGKN